MNKENAIIIGAGTYGQVYLEYLSEIYNIIGFIDDDTSLIGTSFNNIPILGTIEYLYEHITRDTNIFIPIGNNQIRVKLLKAVRARGFKTPNFIHSNTIIHQSVIIGKNAVYILPGTNIMPQTILKDNIMISMGVNIAHHNIIENGCFFSQGTNIGASIHIESLAYFGIGSTIMTGVQKIGKNTLIGAGAVVIKDIPDYAVVAGVPAKILKYNNNEQ